MKADADPNLIVYFDGRYMPLRDARVGILTHALHYGTGVFEGIRAHWNKVEEELFVLRPREHFERWKRNCGILRIHVPASAAELCAITVELMRRNSFHTNVYVRPLAYKSAERVGVSRKTINTVENGVFVPSTVLAVKLASALEASVETLFFLAE